MTRKFTTALRPYVRRRLEEIGTADILVGIPCYNNEETIEHVLRMVSAGLAQYYGDLRSVVLIADGGSTDDTRDRASEYQMRPWQEKIVSIYRGPAGKGSALRLVFEAAEALQARACLTVDSDLRSIHPGWVKNLVDPVMERGCDFVAPVYTRHKYDGTITNNIVYNLVRTLYGKRIRQPIGGDFALSRSMASRYLEQDVWTTDVARFGIDIWMTTTALVSTEAVCQANLGVKVHDAKDPAASLGPMFRQVCGTLFEIMERDEPYWRSVRGSVAVPILGEVESVEPEPVTVDLARMVREYAEAWRLFRPLWASLFSAGVMAALDEVAEKEPEDFLLPIEAWVKLLYELAAAYHHLAAHRQRLLGTMTPLYLARVASFVNRTRDMSSTEAEAVVEEQAEAFERMKPYLLELWDDGDRHAKAGAALEE